jgi:uncharacterized RDD family membrane protein YckC
MSDVAHPPEPVRGYLSEESKRRFTIVAGVLGAVFFLAQLVLPVVLMFLIVFSGMMLQESASSAFDRAVLWRGELWYVEAARKLKVRESGKGKTELRLRHARLTDLEQAAETVAVDVGENEWDVALLPQGDRLWLIGESEVGYYEAGAFKKLGAARRPVRASAPFLEAGQPAVITRGRSSRLAVLRVQGTSAEWQSEPFALDPPLEEGQSVTELSVVSAAGRMYLVAEIGGEESAARALYYREITQRDWRRLLTSEGCCPGWAPAAVGGRLAVIESAHDGEELPRLSIVTVGEHGESRRQDIVGVKGLGRTGWAPLPTENGLLLVSEGMPGSRRLAEVVDGKVVRSISTRAFFPFGGGMLAFVVFPYLLPAALSLLLAFLLTAQMRKHRVQTYVAQGGQRKFATLWQRAWAQVVDALVLGAGFLVPLAYMWRMFSDPEGLLEDAGPSFPLWFFGLFAFGFVWMLLVLVGFSYLEGRCGKTPGKWLLGIRVVGSDLRPCGFWRALVRNLLTFVDGFFNFLVGVLLVALTENWQRLGDLAARTLVVIDEKAP